MCSTGALPVGSHAIGASYAGDSGNVASSAAALTQVVNTVSLMNVALAANGGVASASSTLAANYPVAAVNDGDVIGKGWGDGGGWADATPGIFPDWIEIDFNGTKTISSVVVYSLQDDYGIAGAPSDTTRANAYGISDFDVQAWNGSAWVTLASINDNALAKRTVNFANYSTDRIRVNVIAAFGIYSRVVEVEAWGN